MAATGPRRCSAGSADRTPAADAGEAGGTAQAYGAVCATGLQLSVAAASMLLQEDSLGLTLRLQCAGKYGTMDAARARAQLETLRAAMPPLHRRRQ